MIREHTIVAQTLMAVLGPRFNSEVGVLHAAKKQTSS